MFPFLKAETGELHRRLERNMGLLDPPLSMDRFAFVLGRFASFHRAWEPALSAHPALATVMAGKSRVAHAERDLAALGIAGSAGAVGGVGGADGARDGAPAADVCGLAEALLIDAESAMGSVYVMQGSTLGGQAINRAVERQAWAPQDGFHYFGSPDRDVRKDWDELQCWAESYWPPASWPSIALGARATFVALDGWLSPRCAHG